MYEKPDGEASQGRVPARSTGVVDDQCLWIRERAWVQPVLFVFSWLGVWLLAYVVEYVNHASVWFPAAGLTFAGLLVVGARLIPALVVCAVISTMWTGYLYQLDMSMAALFVPGLVFAVTHIAPYYLATTLLKRLASHQANQLPSIMISFLLIAVLSSLVTAFAVIYGLVFSGLMDAKDIGTAWLPFWVGDMAGIIAVGPLFIGIISKVYPRSQFLIGELKGAAEASPSGKFAFKLVLGCGLLTAITLLAYVYPSQESSQAIFIMLLPLMWISYTESPARTAISIALFSLSVAFLVNVLGLMDFVLTYQFAICIAAASSFFYLSVPSLLAHNQALRQKTITDHLTGVASRNHLVNQAEIEIAKSIAGDQPLCLVVLDVDDFKAINDTLGHTIGDKVLIEISQAAAHGLRKTDLLSRYGGDEFVILLPNTRLEEAHDIAERILKRVQGLALFPDTSFTCSLGVSELRAGEDYRQLFERADKALYQAKNSGRNQVRICTNP